MKYRMFFTPYFFCLFSKKIMGLFSDLNGIGYAKPQNALATHVDSEDKG